MRFFIDIIVTQTQFNDMDIETINLMLNASLQNNYFG